MDLHELRDSVSGTSVYQIRNRIACGFGTKFKRSGNPYTLTDTGELFRYGQSESIEHFATFGWSILP